MMVPALTVCTSRSIADRVWMGCKWCEIGIKGFGSSILFNSHQGPNLLQLMVFIINCNNNSLLRTRSEVWSCLPDVSLQVCMQSYSCLLHFHCSICLFTSSCWFWNTFNLWQQNNAGNWSPSQLKACHFSGQLRTFVQTPVYAHNTHQDTYALTLQTQSAKSD
jgi:hypothetical protein